jgi:hypothetical protein
LVFTDSNASVNTEITLDQLNVLSNFVIGPASLFYISGATKVVFSSSKVSYNGRVSTTNFTSVSSIQYLNPVKINLSQGLGIF